MALAFQQGQWTTRRAPEALPEARVGNLLAREPFQDSETPLGHLRKMVLAFFSGNREGKKAGEKEATDLSLEQPAEIAGRGITSERSIADDMGLDIEFFLEQECLCDEAGMEEDLSGREDTDPEAQ